jgi:thiosulfate/3-mercaptopyruvate sulfurtransferase
MKLGRLLTAATTLVFIATTAMAQTPSGPLVTGEWLEKNASDPKVRIVEVSVEPGLFERGHIPNAQNVVWHTDLVDPVRRDIAAPESFQALARKLGIDKDTTLVLYGDNNNWFAAWGAWVFKSYGFENVKLLDGGRKKWEADKRPYDTRVASITASNVTVSAANNKLRARLREADGKVASRFCSQAPSWSTVQRR